MREPAVLNLDRTARPGRCISTKTVSFGCRWPAPRTSSRSSWAPKRPNRPDRGRRRPRTSSRPRLATRSARWPTRRLPDGRAAAGCRRRRRLPAAVAEHEFLLVERYDGANTTTGRARLHQEDFCQALGAPRRRKYQSEGGPSDSPDCFALLRRGSLSPRPGGAQAARRRRCSASSSATTTRMERTTRCSIVPGIAQARFSAPPMTSSALFVLPQGPRLSRKMAMSIGGEYRAEYVSLPPPRPAARPGRPRGGGGKAADARHRRQRSRCCSPGARRPDSRRLGLAGTGARRRNGRSARCPAARDRRVGAAAGPRQLIRRYAPISPIQSSSSCQRSYSHTISCSRSRGTSAAGKRQNLSRTVVPTSPPDQMSLTYSKPSRP